MFLVGIKVLFFCNQWQCNLSLVVDTVDRVIGRVSGLKNVHLFNLLVNWAQTGVTPEKVNG